MVEQRDNGKAVLLISFELDEIVDLSDRIAVIFNGKIVDVLDAKTVDEKNWDTLWQEVQKMKKTDLNILLFQF